MNIADRHLDPLLDASPFEAAEFIADLCEDLGAIAERAGHRYLTYVLELARQEARARAEAVAAEAERRQSLAA